MRILNAVTTALLAATACYSPNSETCQFTCSAEDNNACPSGLNCVSGVCQTGSQNMCGQGTIDAAVKDAPNATADAPPNTACEPVPTHCRLVSGASANCLALCESNPQPWMGAAAACEIVASGSAWQLASFETFLPVSGELPATKAVWIGLTRQLEGAAADWKWLGTNDDFSATNGLWSTGDHDGTTGKFAAILGGRLFSDETGSGQNAFACTHAPAISTGGSGSGI